MSLNPQNEYINEDIIENIGQNIIASALHVSKKITYIPLKIALIASRTGRHVPQHAMISGE